MSIVAARRGRLVLFSLLCLSLLCAGVVWRGATLAAAAAEKAAEKASDKTEKDADAEKPLAEFGIDTRTPWTESRVIGSPDPPPPFRLARAFENFTFKRPLFITREPTSDRLFVVEQKGRIYEFTHDESAAEPKLWFDVATTHDLPEDAPERDRPDAYSFCFHPRYAENGYIYLFSNGAVEDEKHNRITRYTVSRDTGRIDPASRLIVLDYWSNGHNGHHLGFGPDGMLYITAGDGTSGMDPKLDAQNITNLRGNVLRIDVDHPTEDHPYSIPKDNPFLDTKIDGVPARPEIWAFGFRNPYRLTFDPETGHLWIADIGQDVWEMIHLVQRGGNHGWSVMEAAHPLNLERPRGPGEFIPPIVEHPHSEMRSITGGFFYRGKKFPELQGAYLYGDYDTGKMFGVRYDYDKRQVTWQQELADTALRVLSIGEDRDGEALIVDYGEGGVYRMERTPPVTEPNTFPRRLSETGIFDDVAKHRVKPGLIPYSVNSPLWSDGAIKERYIGVPGDGKVGFVAGNWRGWKFPQETVLVKSFSLETSPGDPDSRRYIETRLLTLQIGPQGGEWVGYSYRWNGDQTDAVLVEREGLDETFTIRDESDPDGIRQQKWRYPSRAECMACHTREARYVLGLTTLQMNKVHDYGQVRANQLTTLAHLEMFERPLGKSPEEFEALPDPMDESQPLEARARAYLHANCSQCHVSNGGGNSKMKIDYLEKREAMEIFDVVPEHKGFGIDDVRLIAPGDPQRSLILQRIARRGQGQMPPLGSHVVDERGVALLRQWIESLQE
ncbi:MAG: PQQ-dependent sugar dehydrogenase [Pirellulaceae bacterium]